MGQHLGFELAGLGSYLPERVIANEQLAELGCDSDWILRRSGIRERRRAAADQCASDLAVEAAKRCLAQSNIPVSEVDLIVVATMTPDQLAPSTACHVQHKLGCLAPAMDVSAACAGFMYALVTAGQFVRSGAASCALVIGTEVMSRITNPRDVKTFPLFGDGAGAVLLRPCVDVGKGMISYTLGSEGNGWEMLHVPSGGSRQALTPERLQAGEQFLRMEGPSVFKWAVRAVADSIRDCLDHAALGVEEVDLFVMHQANIRIIEAAADDLNIDRQKLCVNLDRYGNTSAASIPIVLDEAKQSGLLPVGSKVLLCGFGAGLTWGTAIVQM
jgi:3-oxoacyl-[acyl-carrier-protein] synthase-3